MFREPGIRCCQHSKSRLTALPRGEGWLSSPPLRANKAMPEEASLSTFPQQSETQTDLQYLPCLLCICALVCPVEEELSLDGVVCEACGLLEEPCSKDPRSRALLLVFLCFFSSPLSSGKMQGCLLPALLGVEMPVWSQLPLMVAEEETASFFCLSLIPSCY